MLKFDELILKIIINLFSHKYVNNYKIIIFHESKNLFRHLSFFEEITIITLFT